jgi:bifunctional DNA-binding transcriptional regulator/antitoxin component of YhaV-PrlF toxin-antitoxin module
MAPRLLPRRLERPRGELDGPPAGVILGARRFDPLRATLKLSARGALTIPAKLRRALAIEDGGELVAEATPHGLLLRPVFAFAVETAESVNDHPDATTPLARRKVRRRFH